MKKLLTKGTIFLCAVLSCFIFMQREVYAAEKFDFNYSRTATSHKYYPGTIGGYSFYTKGSNVSLEPTGYKKVSLSAQNPSDKTLEGKYVYRVTNTKKDTDKYVIFRNGAKSIDFNEDGTYDYLDVKVYLWLEKTGSSLKTSDYYCGFRADSVGAIEIWSKSEDNTIKLRQEYHFYKPGTAGTNDEKEVGNVEMTFNITDIDTVEYWSVSTDNKLADYALSTDTYDLCVHNIDEPANSNEEDALKKNHITKVTGDTWTKYSASHYVNGAKPEICNAINSHMLWVDISENKKSGIKLIYEAGCRGAGLSYYAVDLRRTVTLTHYINDKKTDKNSGGTIDLVYDEIQRNTTGTFGPGDHYYTGTRKVSIPKVKITREEVSEAPSGKFKKVDTNNQIEPDYTYVYIRSGNDLGSSETDNLSATYKWYSRYFVEYQGNGNTSGEMESYQTHRYGVAQELLENKYRKNIYLFYNYMCDYNGGEKQIPLNCSFKSWNTQANGTGSPLADKASVSGLTKTADKMVTLYAQWNPASVVLESPTRRGWSFGGWYKNDGKTKVGNGGETVDLYETTGLYAKWIDSIKPVVSVTAEPSTWAKEANVTITALDEGSGVKTVQLYRVDSSNKETLVQTWTENPTISTQKTYTFVDTEEGSYSYKVVVSDNVGNQGVATSGKVYIDRTAPVVDESVVQGPGTYQFPVANLKNDNDEVNSECFGLYITLDASDKNGTKAVSNIKQAYVKVYNTDNPSQCYLYDLTQKAENTIERSGVDIEVPSPLNGELNTINQVAFEKRAIIDLTKDFNRVLNLSWEIHVIDVAGNDAYDVNPALKGSHQRDVEVFATIRRITYDKDLTSPTQFRSGYKGILRLTTTGWVDRINTHWAEEILRASLKDQELNQVVMVYDTTLNQSPTSNPTKSAKDEKLNENNTIKSLDTHGTTFTRVYEFYFWIPLYQEYKDPDGSQPFLRSDGIYRINIDTERDYGYPQRNNGVQSVSVDLTIGDGNIFKRIRSSILY